MTGFIPPAEWSYDYDEPCASCGCPGNEHCLDDECCAWDFARGEYGGACLNHQCAKESFCEVYRPRSIHAIG